MDNFGGIEAGGAKFNCIVAGDGVHHARIPTTSLQETLAQAISGRAGCR